MSTRRMVKPVQIGKVLLSADSKIAIQSMLNLPADRADEAVRQAQQLEAAGCDIIRIAVPDKESVALISHLKSVVSMPVVADIHFDYKLALESVQAGVDKIRINPGNIGDTENIKKVADACRRKNIPVRIGVNSGSVEKEILKKYGKITAEAMVESALYHVSLFNQYDFDNLVLSIKASDVKLMLDAYRLVAERTSYPLHLGVTEAGTERMGLIKSAIGIGALLADGIGDTIRVSLTDAPVKEIAAAKDILKALGIKGSGPVIISCPTCGRTKIDLIGLANQVENLLKNETRDIKVAVMGCVVNGPGEAREADIGIAGGDGCAVLFKKGEIVCKLKEEEILGRLRKELENSEF